jgi:hypothetical protein
MSLLDILNEIDALRAKVVKLIDADPVQAARVTVTTSATPVYTDPTLAFLQKIMPDGKPTPERDAAIDRYMANVAAQEFGGEFPVGSLTLADKAWLARMQPQFLLSTGKDIWRAGIVAGKHGELNDAARDGEMRRNDFREDEADANLRHAVFHAITAANAARVKPN